MSVPPPDVPSAERLGLPSKLAPRAEVAEAAVWQVCRRVPDRAARAEILAVLGLAGVHREMVARILAARAAESAAG